MLDLKRFNGSQSAVNVLKGLSPFERSEFRRLFHNVETIGFEKPEALVEVENESEVQLISENRWIVTFKTDNRKFNIIIKDQLTELYVESIELEK